MDHSSTIERALAWYGVRSVEDRADLAHDVFLAGYRALLRGETLANPRAWLWNCARKHASNYRRKSLRRLNSTAAEVVNAMPTPEQIVEQREILCRLFDCVEDEAQRIIFDVRIEHLTWEEIARERGLSVDQARYLFQRALAQLEEALEKDDSTRKEQKSFVLAIAMDDVFEAVRAEADTVSPEMRRRIWESLERRMDAEGASAGDPNRAQAISQRPSPVSIQIHTAPAAALSTGAVVGMVGNGVVLGLLLGYLAHDALPKKRPSVPSRTESIPVLAMGESANSPGAFFAPAQLLPSTEAADLREESLAPSPSRDKSAPAASPLKASSTMAPRMLVERARAAFKAGNVQAALALLAPRAGHSPQALDAEDQRKLLRLLCADPAARDARECADEKAGPALE
jgi:RNA polymerase sigma factor (sigma-70 family)